MLNFLLEKGIRNIAFTIYPLFYFAFFFQLNYAWDFNSICEIQKLFISLLYIIACLNEMQAMF